MALQARQAEAENCVVEHPCWRLCPSDLTFLWGECRRCFYLKKVHNFHRPQTPFPKIFNQIDAQMKACYMSRPTEEITSSLPKGVIAFCDKTVRSVPIEIAGHKSTVVLHGRLDTGAMFEDDTAGLLDFKTGSPCEEYITYYSRQLHTYAIAAELAAPGAFAVAKVSKLGLLVFEPKRFTDRPNSNNGIDGYFGGGLHWIEIPRNDEEFMEFLDEVLCILELPEAPAPSPSCSFCSYLERSRRMAQVEPMISTLE